MVTDPIADMLVQIKNAVMAGNRFVELPYSKMKFSIASILSREGYIGAVETLSDGPKRTLKVRLAYEGKAPVLTDVTRISKPGLRRYINKHEIPLVVGGLGIAILSTPQGVMTGKEAKKRGIGGELLCKVW